MRSGSVRKLRSGRWQARYLTLDGRRVASRATFTNKTDARLWLAGTFVDGARGVLVDARSGIVPLGDYAREWLSSRVGIAPRTREVYEAQLRRHILPVIDPGVPALGRVALVDITPALVRAWYAALQGQGSHSTAAKAYVRLRQILGHAVDDDLLVKNPCKIERGGVEHHPEQRFATLEELYRLASVVPERYRALLLLAGLCGLRQGELFALRRGDVDIHAGTVKVERKRLRLASGVTIEGDPKSAAGRRRVAMPATILGDVEDHLDHFTGPAPDDYVFTGTTGEPIERNNFRGRIWLPALSAVTLQGLRFHDLRHTAGTLAARTGATTKELMARLGHASAQAAMVYQHAADDRDRLVAERLAQMTVDAGLAPPRSEKSVS